MIMKKNKQTSSITMSLLKLLHDNDLYGYQIIEQLQQQSNPVFALKAGTLYPVLHSMEEQGFLQSYEKIAETGRNRKYYQITKKGHKLLLAGEPQHLAAYDTTKQLLKGGGGIATIQAGKRVCTAGV